MDLVIDFVVENYIWFIVGVIVLLMIIIGFIAEKTDFGRKPFSDKKKEKVEKKEESEDSMIEEVKNNEANSYDEPVVEDINDAIDIPEVSDEPETTDEKINNISVEDVDSDTGNSEDLNTPFGDQEVVEAVDEEPIPTNEEETTSEDDVWKF